jgi:hypothetical protein
MVAFFQDIVENDDRIVDEHADAQRQALSDMTFMDSLKKNQGESEKQ